VETNDGYRWQQDCSDYANNKNSNSNATEKANRSSVGAGPFVVSGTIR